MDKRQRQPLFYRMFVRSVSSSPNLRYLLRIAFFTIFSFSRSISRSRIREKSCILSPLFRKQVLRWHEEHEEYGVHRETQIYLQAAAIMQICISQWTWLIELEERDDEEEKRASPACQPHVRGEVAEISNAKYKLRSNLNIENSATNQKNLVHVQYTQWRTKMKNEEMQRLRQKTTVSRGVSCWDSIDDWRSAECLLSYTSLSYSSSSIGTFEIL